MTFEFLILDQSEAVATITLNRPDRLNALGAEMLDELAEALRSVLRAGDARAIVLGAAGRGFCAGADLRAARRDNGRDVDATMRDQFNATALLLRECPLPTVAAVNGAAAGAGSSLALLCDFVVAGTSAYFQQSFSNIGYVPDTGASWLLPRALGTSRATELMMLGDRLPAQQAVDWGLIHKCVPDEALQQESRALAVRLASRPTVALGLIKRLIRHGATNSLRDQMLLEQEFQRIARATEDSAEARAAFKDKRPPVFKGR
jgi:2-(1,2-epoxy-1,2-dihydrophenyl)acetyl-CoA isomerase